jgi:hypothetical protein
MTQKQTPPKEALPIFGHALRLIAYELSVIGTKEKESKEQNKPA